MTEKDIHYIQHGIEHGEPVSDHLTGTPLTLESCLLCGRQPTRVKAGSGMCWYDCNQTGSTGAHYLASRPGLDDGTAVQAWNLHIEELIQSMSRTVK